MIRGFIVNKFRGDPTLFADGMAAIAQRDRMAGARASCRISRDAAQLPAEDALGARISSHRRRHSGRETAIAVPVLPRIANFDDLDPLRDGAGRRS